MPQTSALAPLLTVPVRLAALLVVLASATIGTMAVGFGVLTGCTNNYSCSSSWCGPCVPASSLMTAQLVAQVVLGLVAVALLVPRVSRRLGTGGLVAVAAAVLVASPLLLGGAGWVADRSYCRGGPADANSYCDVEF